MKPEKQEVVDSNEEFIAIGVPSEWVEPLKAQGYMTVSALQAVNKPGKLANDLNVYMKKKKLDMPGLSPEVVSDWLRSNNEPISKEPDKSPRKVIEGDPFIYIDKKKEAKVSNSIIGVELQKVKHCEAINSKGKPCGIKILKSEKYCHYHKPSRSKDAENQ